MQITCCETTGFCQSAHFPATGKQGLHLQIAMKFGTALGKWVLYNRSKKQPYGSENFRAGRVKPYFSSFPSVPGFLEVRIGRSPTSTTRIGLSYAETKRTSHHTTRYDPRNPEKCSRNPLPISLKNDKPQFMLLAQATVNRALSAPP